jgi:hypothetical protein
MPAQRSPRMTTETHERDRGSLVGNVTVRRAVGQFAAEPSRRAALEVLHECMPGVSSG